MNHLQVHRAPFSCYIYFAWPRICPVLVTDSSSRVIAGPLWHLWNDSTVKESKLPRLTHNHRHHSAGLNVAVGFGNGTACSTKHVLLRSVSGNGSRAKIKSRRGHHFREKTNYPPPPGKNVMWGTWGRVGGSAVRGWVCLNSKSRGYFFFLSLPMKKEEGVEGGWVQRQLANKAESSLTCSTKRMVTSAALSGKKALTQSMCCTSHMCSLGLLNAVIRLPVGSKPQHNNKALFIFYQGTEIVLHQPKTSHTITH